MNGRDFLIQALNKAVFLSDQYSDALKRAHAENLHLRRLFYIVLVAALLSALGNCILYISNWCS
jgi:hypothetical protein